MPRYIDADEALRMMRNSKQDNPCNTPEKGIWKTAHDCCMSCVDSVSTADVVPASEIAKEFTCFVGDPHKVEHCPYLEEIENAKAEVAREIFEEIEKAMADLEYRANTPRKTVKVEELKDQVNWVLHEVVPKTIAELKKKYTEGENQCAEERG